MQSSNRFEIGDDTSSKPAVTGVVLLVEDDVAIRGVYAKVLASAGHTVHTADNGLQALEQIAKRRHDVVVSDISMPGMSGIELLRAIRDRRLDLPVILLTACPDVKTAAEAVERQALRYLLKPVPLPELRAVVSGAIKTQRERAQREAHGVDVHMSLAELVKACNSAEALLHMWRGGEGDEKQRYAASFGESIAGEIAGEARRARAFLSAFPLSEQDAGLFARWSEQLDEALRQLGQLAAGASAA